MGTADTLNSPIIPPPGDDSEEQGLRILAKIIARKLANSRIDEGARAYERGADDSSASGDAG
ncbi:hypothetical protein ACFLXC_06600 [Chloroflexota bacterium]